MNGTSESENRKYDVVDSDAFDLGGQNIPEKANDTIRYLDSKIKALSKEIKANKDRILELEALVDSDPLVPVFNRRAFMREVNRTNSDAERYGDTNCLFYMDIDGMKPINDQHGHAAGDAALVRLGEFLQQNFHASDLVARLGGDEFGVIMEKANYKTATLKATHLQELIKQIEIKFANAKIMLSVKLEFIEMTPKMTAAEALKQTDDAMYDRK
ncbi:MAG: GGDEF domain-containing protein [Pseudomonadota bacterium]|nr:GGDEF domain-containing protein [Pseudomonadota bacterium]